VSDVGHGNELEGILIAAMPTANSAKPKLQRERMPKEVRDLLKQINLFVPGASFTQSLRGLILRF
jgi:hypothetical protein